MNKILASVFIILLFSGCTQILGATKLKIQTDAEFNQLFLKDVQTATMLAEMTDDQLALRCWTYLEQFTVDNTPDTVIPEGEVSGVLSTYQKVRNVRRTVGDLKITDAFRLACGPMLIESMGVLGRLGVRAAL